MKMRIKSYFLKFGEALSLYDKYVIQGATITTFNYSKSKQFQDYEILYRRGNELFVGIINKIIFVEKSDNLLL